jgi:hypothetical protein
MEKRIEIELFESLAEARESLGDELILKMVNEQRKTNLIEKAIHDEVTSKWN